MERTDEEWASWWDETGLPELRRRCEAWWDVAQPQTRPARPPDFHAIADELSRSVRGYMPADAIAERLRGFAAATGHVVDDAATERAAEQIASWGCEALDFRPERIVTVDAGPDGRTVALEQFEVTGLRLFRHQLDVLLIGPVGETSKVVLEGEFTLMLADGREHELACDLEWEALVPLFRLRGAEVATVLVRPAGTLHVTFTDGTRLDAPPAPDGEAWQIVGPDRLLVVCPPGGGDPVIWDQRPPR